MNSEFILYLITLYWKSCVCINKFCNRKEISIYLFFWSSSRFPYQIIVLSVQFNCIIEYLIYIVRTKVALWNSVFIWIPPDHNINPHIHQNALPFLTHKNLNVNLIHRYSTFEDTDFLNRLNYERPAVINL